MNDGSSVESEITPQDPPQKGENNTPVTMVDRDQGKESIWSSEPKTTDIDSISVTAPEIFSGDITRYLSTMHIPRRLYAGDRIAPIRPIDAFAAAAGKMGITGKKIEFIIGDASYIDSSDDSEALVVCLSKYELTNPRTGLLEQLAINTKNLLTNQGKVVLNKAAREAAFAKTDGYIFGRARGGENHGYQIPPEHQRAYYRGVDYNSLGYITEAGGFVGRNSDALDALIDPTVWAYTDPGMAETFGGRGKGIVFKMKKQEIDDHFRTDPGWQRWTVNEVMIQPKEDEADSIRVPLDGYVEQILVFDDEGQRRATELFPNIPQVYLKSKEDGQQYLIKNDEITNESLERYYDSPDKVSSYIKQAEEAPVFELCSINENMSYDDARAKMEAKRDDLSKLMLTSLELSVFQSNTQLSGAKNPKELVQALQRQEYYILPAGVKQVVDQDPQIVERVTSYYKSISSIEALLRNFDSYDELRTTAEKFKQKA